MKKRIKKKLIKKGIIKIENTEKSLKHICYTCKKLAECHIGFDGDFYCSKECELRQIPF